MSAVSKFLGTAIVLASASFSVAAYAAPSPSSFVSTFSTGATSSPTYSPSSGTLGAATQVTLGSQAMSTFQGSGITFAPSAVVTFSNNVVNLGSPGQTSGSIANIVATWFANNINFTFTATNSSYNSTTQSTTANNTTSTTDFINLSYFGTLTSDQPLLYATQTGIFTETLSSSGSASVVSQSGSFVTPAPVPEPVSMLLLGTGLVGLLAARRRA